MLRPKLGETFLLTQTGAHSPAETAPPRLSPDKVVRLDWHNDVSRLILEINEALRASPDEKTRDVLIRKLHRALGNDESSR